MADSTPLTRKRLRDNKTITCPARFVPRFWEDSDMRIAVAKTIKRRYERIKADAGGDESYQRDLLCQRVAFVSVILETQEVRCSEGDPEFDLGSYTQAVNAMNGLLKHLGLERHAKNVTDLTTYLDGKRRGANGKGTDSK